MIVEMKKKNPTLPPQGMVTHHLKGIIEEMNELIPFVDWDSDEEKIMDGAIKEFANKKNNKDYISLIYILSEMVKTNKKTAESLRTLADCLEKIASLSEKQDSGRAIIWN